MKQYPLSCALAFFVAMSFTPCGHAAPPGSSRPEVQQHFKQLMETRACPGCDLAEVDLTRTDLKGVNLEGANLSGAKLSLTDLSGANLKNANLQDANLGGADLAGADLTGANLDGAVVEGAFLDAIQGKRASAARPMPTEQPAARVEAEQSAPVSAGSAPSRADEVVAPMPPPAGPTSAVTSSEQDSASGASMTAPAILGGEPEPTQPKQLTPMAEAVVPVEAMQSSPPAEITADAAAPKPVAQSMPAAAQQAVPIEERTSPPSVHQNAADQGKQPPVTGRNKEPEPIPDLAKEPEPAAEAVVIEPTAPKPEVVEAERAPVKPAHPIEVQPPSLPKAAELTAEKQAALAQLFAKKRCVDCDLAGVDLAGKNLDGFDLERANLKDSNLRGADLEKANLKGATLDGASLRDADLRKADLYRASFRAADLTGARLEKALVDATDWTDAVGVNLEGATVVK